MDSDPDTGGELDAPHYRYLGNAVRFGGNVTGDVFRERVARDASAFDDDFETAPQVERHGEEFHLALLGTEFRRADIDEVEGNGDAVFEAGETWNLRGTFFHRAHGYEPFSFVEGGRYPGEYTPLCDLQFLHDPTADQTRVTLVFSLTNEGAALRRGEPVEPNNQDPTDQASVLEGLEDLQLSAFFLPILPTGLPEEAILRNWADRNPADYLDPTVWSLTAIFGSSYTMAPPGAVYFLWTDIYPDVVPGDVDGSGLYDGRDRQLIAQMIALRDHLDGVIDGVFTILNFATDFSLFDVNHDGVVDAFDLRPTFPDADGDRDGDVDLRDVALMQGCFAGEDRINGACQSFDLVPDLRVNLRDLGAFQQRLGGPLND